MNFWLYITVGFYLVVGKLFEIVWYIFNRSLLQLSLECFDFWRNVQVFSLTFFYGWKIIVGMVAGSFVLSISLGYQLFCSFKLVVLLVVYVWYTICLLTAITWVKFSKCFLLKAQCVFRFRCVYNYGSIQNENRRTEKWWNTENEKCIFVCRRSIYVLRLNLYWHWFGLNF